MEIGKPASGEVQVVERDGRLVLRRRTGSFVIAGFLLFWLIGCAAAGAVLAGRVLPDPFLLRILLAASFLIAWIFGVGLLANLLLGFEELTVAPDGLCLRTLLGRKNVPLAAVNAVTCATILLRRANPRIATTNPRKVPVMKIETKGSPIDFGQGVDREELLRLKELVEQRLAALGSRRLNE